MGGVIIDDIIIIMEGNLTTKRFKKKKNRTEWDSTLSDVSAYRSTPSELERRHLSHISKNLEAARRDLYDKPKVTAATKSKKLIQKADEVLAGMDDIFLNNTKCTRGHPNLTLAPHLLKNKENINKTSSGQLIVSGSPGGIAREDITLPGMAPPILNDVTLPSLNDDGSDNNNDDDNEDVSGYQPLLDLTRYESYIKKEQKEMTNENTIETVIRNLEQEMEQLRGEPSGPQAHHHGNHIERLAHVSLELVEYSKRAKQEIEEEKRLQEQVLLTVEEQQSLIDVMAADVVEFKEKCNEVIKEKESLEVKVQQLEKSFSEQMEMIKKEIKRRDVPPSHPFIPVILPGPHPNMPHLLPNSKSLHLH